MLCGILLNLTVKLNTNKLLSFVNKEDTEGVTVMHLTRTADEKLDDISQITAGSCIMAW
jgi:hypothetical protein